MNQGAPGNFSSRTLDVLDSLITYVDMTVRELMEDIGTQRRAAIDDAIDRLIDARLIEKGPQRRSRLLGGERQRSKPAQSYKLHSRLIAFDEAQKVWPHMVENSGGQQVRRAA